MDRFHLCTSECRRRAPCSEWVIETMRESPCLSVSFSQWKSARHRFCLPYICPDGESRGLGHHAPTPHTNSMSSMPAMLKFASTFVPRLVKKAKETNFPVGPVWNIMLYFDCITCGDLSRHWGQIPRFTVCLLAAAFLCKLWSCWFERMSYSCGLFYNWNQIVVANL